MYQFENGKHIVDLTFGQIKREFLAMIEQGYDYKSSNSQLVRLAQKWGADPYDFDPFMGQAPATTCDHLRNGYRPENIFDVSERNHVAKKPRFVYDECEGEVDVGMLLAGSDEPFLNIERREGKPGLRLELDFAFLGSVNAKQLALYGEWIAGLIAGLEASGFDLEVFITSSRETRCYSSGYDFFTNRIQVKKFGEKSNFTEWSALFSPGGYRHLIWTAATMCTPEFPVPFEMRVESSASRSAGVCEAKWDAEKRLITTTTDHHRGRIDPEALTETVRAAGLLS